MAMKQEEKAIAPTTYEGGVPLNTWTQTNCSSRANILAEKMYSSGRSKTIWMGYYTDGPRCGQYCVSKRYKSIPKNVKGEDELLENKFKALRLAQEWIDAFNDNNFIHNWKIFLNTPTVWTDSETGKKQLIEPFIESFEKFNGWAGWVAKGAPYMDAIQALSHYSYHVSNRQFLLYDLKGGKGNRSEGDRATYDCYYILTDPSICTPAEKDLRALYDGDIGDREIKNFFEAHHCGAWCNPQWLKPIKPDHTPFQPKNATQSIKQEPKPVNQELKPIKKEQ